MFSKIRKEPMSERLTGIEIECHVTKGSIPVNVATLIDDTKENQKTVRSSDGTFLGTYHYDNALLERTTAPSAGGNAVNWHLSSVYTDLRYAIRRSHGLQFGHQPNQLCIDTHSIARSYLEEEMVDTQFWIGGCDPSLNAYHSEGALSVPKYTSTERYGGYHLNFDTSGEDHKDLARYLDRTLGLVDVLLSPTPEEGARRREFYGRPGEYRTKDFGIEYRALPNNATRHIRMLAEVGARLVDKFYEGTEKSPIWAADDASVEEAMMNYDKKLASQIVKPYFDEVA